LFIRSYYDKNKTESLGFQLQKLIEKEIIMDLKYAHRRLDKSDFSDFEIAFTSIAFDQQKLIKKLTERGDYIKNKDSTRLMVCNEQLDSINSDKLSRRPMQVFITFQRKEDAQLAKDFF
jgi:hypothetical protein